ncbi:Transcription factor HY5 [Camellia lanceoleosa]|uniref:Transcription factor HY5 n=1 Tax=Camellia lanceoleosa TaxID=1840588 RepID=A0ACC0G0J5_9ERIC|nr:Transcription factor HY5 [Camellia lanceoleosa]
MESDDEIRRVPEIGGEAARGSVSFREAGPPTGPDRAQASPEGMRKTPISPPSPPSSRQQPAPPAVSPPPTCPSRFRLPYGRVTGRPLLDHFQRGSWRERPLLKLKTPI